MRHRLLLGVLFGLALPCAAQTAPNAPAAPGYHIVKKTVLGGEGGWDYLTAAPTARLLYITRGDHVMVVDTTTDKLVGELPQTGGIHGVALDPSSHHLFVTNGQDNTVLVFDQAAHKREAVTRLASIAVGQRPDAILYDRASKRVFAMNGGSNDATAIDPATNIVAGAVKLGGRPEYGVVDGRGTVYVNLEDKNEIVAFDAKALKVTKRWSLAPGEEPSGLALDPRNNRLFSVCSNGKMMVSDPAAGKVAATVPIGQGPDAVAYDSRLRLVFCPNGRDGTLTVIHEDAPDRYTVVETVPTQAGCRTMALEPRTHHVFTVTAEPDPTPPPAGENPRRRYKPGTFTLIELAPRDAGAQGGAR